MSQNSQSPSKMFYFNLYNFKFASKNDYAICLALILS